MLLESKVDGYRVGFNPLTKRVLIGKGKSDLNTLENIINKYSKYVDLGYFTLYAYYCGSNRIIKELIELNKEINRL